MISDAKLPAEAGSGTLKRAPQACISLIVATGLSLAAQPGCESCHAEIVKSFAATGMGQSVGLPATATTRFRHERSSSILSVVGTRHRIERESLSAEYPVTLRIGSGKIGSSFAVLIGAHWFQSPISWYAQSRQFRISPGYEQERHPDFDRRIRSECLYCHASGVDGLPVAIRCERCHGDGRQHTVRPARSNIVNPARLDAAHRDSVCEQCHLPGVARILNPGKRAEDFHPGQALEDTWTTFVKGGDFRVTSHSEQLARSACMNASSAKLWCGSCHNPHPTKARPSSSVDVVCLSCHKPHDGGKALCADCHMPKRGVQDVVHTTYTDHRIQRSGSPPPPAVSRLRTWRPSAGDFGSRNLGLALFESAVAARDLDSIQEAFRQLIDLNAADDPPVLSALGTIAMQKDRPLEAVNWFRKAVHLQPANAETHFRLGRAEQAAGRPDAAAKSYDTAIRLDPLFFDAYVVKAQLYRSRGDWDGYRRVLGDYLRHVPNSLAARQAIARSQP